MKNFSKTLISMAAVMAVGSAMAVSAMANDLSINTDALKSAGTITIGNVTPNKSQYTLLVVKGTADSAGAYTYDANSSTIKQVDQNDVGTPFSSIVLGTLQKDGTYKLDEGSYKVLVGNNDGSLDSGIFTVSNTPVVEYEEIIIGDVNGDKMANTADATCIIYKDTYMDLFYGKDAANTGNSRTGKDKSNIIIGDVNGDGMANTADATCIIYKDTYMDLFYGKDPGNTGNTVEVEK